MATDIDTLYVERPMGKWVVKGRFNFSSAEIGTQGTDQGQHFRSELIADYKSTLSIAVGYRGLTAALALNPAKLLGYYNDYELNLQSYGTRYGFEFSYQDARNFTGWSQVEEEGRMELPSDLLSMKMLHLNTYYVFSHRRFSYPAAFTQSYIQRQSAGSFLLAASGQRQQGTVGAEQDFRFRMTNIGIGGGYGYNYVPARNWLLHISALPTFIIYSKTSVISAHLHVPLKSQFPEVIITGRGSFVREFGNKFAGLSAVFNYSNIGSKDNLCVQNMKWLTRIFFGIRF
ncbi:MAG: DUF4421 domain-containing protein [Prevotella sp.]|nr:DUF4421 domain-containing protein [Prevotella sp.]